MTDTGEIVVERDLMVRARDGAMLATDVYRPAGPGPFPVLLERTPYDKSAPSRSERTAAAARPGRGPKSPLISSSTAMPSPIRTAAAAIIRAAISQNT
jgi:predicted acyl esterase